MSCTVFVAWMTDQKLPQRKLQDACVAHAVKRLIKVPKCQAVLCLALRHLTHICILLYMLYNDGQYYSASWTA
jgi:hypothetical protein